MDNNTVKAIESILEKYHKNLIEKIEKIEEDQAELACRLEDAIDLIENPLSDRCFDYYSPEKRNLDKWITTERELDEQLPNCAIRLNVDEPNIVLEISENKKSLTKAQLGVVDSYFDMERKKEIYVVYAPYVKCFGAIFQFDSVIWKTVKYVNIWYTDRVIDYADPTIENYEEKFPEIIPQKLQYISFEDVTGHHHTLSPNLLDKVRFEVLRPGWFGFYEITSRIKQKEIATKKWNEYYHFRECHAKYFKDLAERLTLIEKKVNCLVDVYGAEIDKNVEDIRGLIRAIYQIKDDEY